jgi:hypothetical protein
MVTQFDKDDVEAVGLVKFDFLGLRTLTIIDWAVKAINRRRASNGEDELDIDALPLDDARTYALLRAARPRGVPARIARHEGADQARCKPDPSRTSSRWWRCSAPARWAVGHGRRLHRSQARRAAVTYRIPCWNRCSRRPTA